MPRVRTGAERLLAGDFALLKGKRVGLIANHTALVNGTHLADLLARAPGVRLAAILAPEHGFRGAVEAGKKVSGEKDPGTGVPVLSLYGATRKPTRPMLSGLDVLVFDMQDIGSRFYTYISTMGLAMQAAHEAGLPFIVLDRPNPLGGDDNSGFVLETRHRSFVGQYPIPLVHGLTVGELARMTVGAGLLDGVDGLRLDVVPVRGWKRAERWPATGLPWVATSPNIPTFVSALTYPGISLLSATSASDGVGTDEPFTVLGAPHVDGARLAETLSARGLPGVAFAATAFTPRVLPGKASEPKHEGRRLGGVRLTITDVAAYRPLETGIHVLTALAHQIAPDGKRSVVTRAKWLTQLAGTAKLGKLLAEGRDAETIIAAWRDDVARFREQRGAYLLYR